MRIEAVIVCKDYADFLEETLPRNLQGLDGITVTLSGTPAFSVAFATASRAGVVQVNANTYSGSATGTRYAASTNGVIFTNTGGSATYLPGNGAGTTATGGQYS